MPSSVTITWPGKPDLTSRPAPPGVVPPLSRRERWPAGVATGSPPADARGAATIIAGRAEDVLDRWLGDDVAPAGPARPRLVYLDPPFATGSTFTARLPVGARRVGAPVLRLPAYRDAWPDGLAGYLTMMAGLLLRLRDVVADDGWVCLHCDHRASAHLRLLADEILGSEALRNEIVWQYGLGNAAARRGFPRKHDTLLLYARSAAAPFTPVRGDVTAAMAAKYRHIRLDGTRFMRSYGREYDLRGGRPVGSVWDIPSVAPTATGRTGYPTQKPLPLLERLIAATTVPGDLVLDPCCGSGTTLVAATGLGRAAAGIDPSPLAIATTRRRLAGHGGGVDVFGPPADSVTGPRDSHPGNPVGAFRPSATARVAGDRVVVSLTGLAAEAHPGDGTAAAEALHVMDGRLVRLERDGRTSRLTTTWSDWLEGWAVLAGDGVTVVAAAQRGGRDRDLAMSLELPWSDDGPVAALTVRLDDLFGGRSDHAIPVTR